MKTNLKTRPSPLIEFTVPYASSINVNALMEKIRQWEMFADSLEKELREDLAILDMRYCQTPDILSEKRRIKEILGE